MPCRAQVNELGPGQKLSGLCDLVINAFEEAGLMLPVSGFGVRSAQSCQQAVQETYCAGGPAALQSWARTSSCGHGGLQAACLCLFVGVLKLLISVASLMLSAACIPAAACIPTVLTVGTKQASAASCDDHQHKAQATCQSAAAAGVWQASVAAA